MYRRGSGHGGARREIRGGRGLAAASSADAILLALGSTLLNWWEPRTELVTLEGFVITAITPLAGAQSMTQATTANKPTWNETGGANGLPAAVMDATTKFLASGATWAISSRRGIYVVAKAPGTNARAYVSGISNSLYRDSHAGTDKYHTSIAFAGGSEVIPVTTPAIDTNHHLHAIRSESTSGGLNRYQIDGASTTPNFTRTDGFAANATGPRFGQSSASGGTVSCIIVTDDPVDAVDTIVKAYIAAQFGLTLA